MSLRFLADENFRRPILSGVKRREPAIDLARVQEVGLKNHPDPELLAFAARLRDGRVGEPADLPSAMKDLARVLEH